MITVPYSFLLFQSESARFHINPLVDDTTRSLLSPVATESMMAGVMSRTMLIKQHGPTITVQRISQEYVLLHEDVNIV